MKLIDAQGLLAKKETTYLTDPTVAGGTDAVQVTEKRPKFKRTPLFDGMRPYGQASLGTLPMAAKNGFWYDMSGLLVEAKGSGAAYAAGVKPPFVNQLLQACGLTETLVTTPGSESVSYTPMVPGAAFSSIWMELYTAAEKYVMGGGLLSYKFRCNDTGVALFEFSGALVEKADPADTALLAITYGALGVIPITLAGTAVFTLGSFLSAQTRSFEFDLGRKWTPRRNLGGAAGGHSGFAPGKFESRITFTIEKEALVNTPYHSVSGLNVPRLIKDSTQLACNFDTNGVQYNRIDHQFTNGMQILDAEEAEEDSIAVVNITAVPFIAGPTDNAWLKVMWD
jgi:hypothetical protein